MEQQLETTNNSTNPNPNPNPNPDSDLLQLDWGIIDGLLSSAGDGASSSAMVGSRSGIISGEEITMNYNRRDQDHEMMRKLCRGKSTATRSNKATKQKIAFRTRSSEDVLDDGFRWRKYGQKSVKNSIYPRSYYRCAQHTCSVKKQVQRLSEEPSTVLTTYDGRHNHLPEQLMETLAPLLRQIQFLSRF